MKRPNFASRNQWSRASRAGSGGTVAGSWARAAPLSARDRVTAVRGFMSASAAHPAAVHHQHVAVDVVGGRRAQEDHGARDVGGLAPAAGRDAVDDRTAAHGVVWSGAVLSVRT